MLIIHIGTPKTGTKALQEYLLRNSDALLEQGIRYVRAGREKGRGTAHNELARSIKEATDDPAWDRLQDELAGSSSRINIISAEGFWLRDPAALKARLPDNQDIQIVVYLRRQDRYLQSLYMQAVSSGRKHSFAAWRKKVADRGRYLDCIDDWATAFGDDAIVVRPYERNGVVDTVGDFSRLICAEGLAVDHSEHRNPSPRWELLHFVRALNNLRLNVDEHILFKALIGKDDAYARSCDLLTYEESVALLDSYAEDNRILIDTYYHDETAPLFPELVPFDGPERWSMESEQYHKLTVDVLDVLIDFVAEGLITRRTVNDRGNGKRTAGSEPSKRKRRQGSRTENALPVPILRGAKRRFSSTG